jgi:hypothetical protein
MKVVIELNDKKHVLTEYDFKESATRKRDTVLHNFGLFPFPHTDFTEFPFNAKQANCLKSFGSNYAAAKSCLDSMTPEGMRDLLPSTEDVEEIAGGSGRRKRPTKKKDIFDPSTIDWDDSSPAYKKSKITKLKVAPPAKAKVVSSSDVVLRKAKGSERAAAAASKVKPVVGRKHQNALLVTMENGETPGTGAWKNAKNRDVDETVDDYRKKVIPEPVFPVVDPKSQITSVNEQNENGGGEKVFSELVSFAPVVDDTPIEHADSPIDSTTSSNMDLMRDGGESNDERRSDTPKPDDELISDSPNRDVPNSPRNGASAASHRSPDFFSSTPLVGNFPPPHFSGELSGLVGVQNELKVQRDILQQLQATVNKLAHDEYPTNVSRNNNSNSSIDTNSTQDEPTGEDVEDEDWCGEYEFPFNNVGQAILLDGELSKSTVRQRSLVSI